MESSRSPKTPIGYSWSSSLALGTASEPGSAWIWAPCSYGRHRAGEDHRSLGRCVGEIVDRVISPTDPHRVRREPRAGMIGVRRHHHELPRPDAAYGVGAAPDLLQRGCTAREGQAAGRFGRFGLELHRQGDAGQWEVMTDRLRSQFVDPAGKPAEVV